MRVCKWREVLDWAGGGVMSESTKTGREDVEVDGEEINRQLNWKVAERKGEELVFCK